MGPINMHGGHHSPLQTSTANELAIASPIAMAAASFLISCLVVVVVLASGASAQLSSTFYDTSCPNALSTIRTAVNAAVAQEARMGASLLRLHFHDCFVQASRLFISFDHKACMHIALASLLTASLPPILFSVLL